MAVPVAGGRPRSRRQYEAAPVLGDRVRSTSRRWLMDLLRYAVGGIGALVLLQAVNGTMLGLSRLAYSLATNRQIPSVRRPAAPAALDAVRRGDRSPSVLVVGLARRRDIELHGGHLRVRRAARVHDRARLGDRAALPRARRCRRPFRVPLSINVGGGSLPLPAAARRR